MNLSGLDHEFSVLVREMAGWRCAVCRVSFAGARDQLHCSHFWSRVNKSTRFDPDNCEAICWRCHHDLDHHPAKHREWKLKRLGQERYDALAERARRIVKLDTAEVRKEIRAIRAAIHDRKLRRVARPGRQDGTEAPQ